MRIKRIEIIGFKSFCDRTILDFSDPITGVVGPNGCGKSNIVDAIRWCMGEQSAKHLRGKAMDDVIFAGSESRGPAGMAEVSLTFENVDSGPPSGADAAVAGDALSSSAAAERAAAAAARNAGEADSQAGAPPAESGGEPAAEAGEQPAAEASGQPAAEASGQPAAEASGQPEAPSGAGADSEAQELAAAAAGAGFEERRQPIDFSQYSEVTISRRLFRDGSSGYFINKTPCRLRDITDFFLGTGIGTKAYSIIEQGRIGMIVSARPQDRRLLIEEAAGITKFKTKKRSAERKLEQTRHNLLRVSDIVAELDKRLGSLRRQAQKAERYRRYKSEIKDIEMWSAAHAHLGKTAEEKVVVASLEAVREELAEVRGELDSRDASVMAERAELAVEEKRLSSMQEAIYELENRLKLSESKAEYQRREAAELDERVSAARGEIRGAQARRAEAAAEVEERRAALEAIERRAEAGDESLSDKEAAAREARQALDDAQRRLAEARADLGSARTELARADGRREAAQSRREDGRARLDRALREADDVDGRLRSLTAERKRLENELGGLRQTRLDLDEQTGSLEARKAELEETLGSLEAEVETLRTERHRRASRLQSLVEIHEKYEGFARGTRAVMQNSDAVAGGAADRIRGLVADVVEAPERLEAAVEAALGDRLGGVLVSDHGIGVQAVDYLKSTASGRSAFVPVAAPPPTAAAGQMAAGGGGIAFEDRSGAAAAPRQDGVLGEMVDLVGVDRGYDGLARSLLGGIVVVDTLERAVDLHRRGVSSTLVTLDGDVVDARGVVSGGSREAQGASVLAQKREIRELEEITASLDRDLADATARLTAAKQEHHKIDRTLDSVRAETHDRDIEMTSVQKDLSRAQADVDRARGRAAELSSERLELERMLEEVEEEERISAELEAAARERIEGREREEVELVAEVSEGQTRVEALSRALTEAKVHAAELREKRTSAESAIRQLEAAGRELETRLERLEASIRDDSERAIALRAEADELEADLDALRQKRREQAETLREGREAYERRSTAIGEAEASLRALRSRGEALTTEASKLEVTLSSLRSSRQHLEETIADRYQVDLVRCLSDYHLRPQIGAEEESRLGELKRLIERMGADINLTAIEEYEQISQRYEFLSTQQADLADAVRQLEEAIQKINKTSRRLFRDTFDAVNAQFKDVFPRLFRGGQAKLSLSGVEGGDLLDAGIEIFAQPPGKKNTTVDQLSGGEKALTAVALIFAIFLIKPSPFCLLDEVDAPLDDVNVDRYNELVREMTDRSQFIVITHNKRTMEITDRLYGVTMQEPGVSNLVSVNLNKLDGQVAA